MKAYIVVVNANKIHVKAQVLFVSSDGCLTFYKDNLIPKSPSQIVAIFRVWEYLVEVTLP